jgi:TatD DNase family protein
MIVDIHSHLYFPQFEKDLDETIERAKKFGIKTIINSGTDHENNLKVLELSKKYDIIEATLGIYPTTATELSEKELLEEIKFIENNSKNIVGVGEIGLDFKLTSEEKEKTKQVNAFKIIINSLKKLEKPFIIHSRKAEKECIEILEELNAKKVVFHCFSGSHKLIKRIEENGWYVSIPANLDKSEHFQGVVEKISINNILTETDAPFLAPKNEERSEPAFIIRTIKKIAQIKKLTEEETQKNIFFNYQQLFSS